MALTDYKPGLEGVVAAQTRMSMVDGQAGVLVIGGFLLEELALNATFEETVFLLWNDRLPNAAELKIAAPTSTLDANGVEDLLWTLFLHPEFQYLP